MTTIYNRVSGPIDIAAKRKALIAAMFPDGFPTETVALNFGANSIVADHAPPIHYNRIALGVGAAFDQRIKFGYRYCHPTAGANANKILIWIGGHESNRYDDAYPASVTNGGKITHAQRVQMHYLPGSPTDANWKLPLQNGVGIIEQSGLGSYLNSIRTLYSHVSTEHTKFVADLGAEAIGYFLYPHIVAINTAIAAGKKVAVGGFSGGGWATLLLAAIDPRVKLAVSQSGWTGTVADGYVTPGGAAGDGEQIQPDIYAIANAHELAVMGCDGGRNAVHVWNTTAGAGADTVLGLSADGVLGLKTGGLTTEAARYGGRLEFVGFNGLNDPVAVFGNGGTASYASIANAVASCLNAAGAPSGVDPGVFNYTGTGHHVLQATIDLVTTRILQDL